MSLLSIAGASPSDDGFELKSVRFNDGDSPSLSRVLGATRTEKIWTLSFWIKRGHLSTYQCLFSPYNGSGGTNLEIVLDNISGGAGDRLDFYYHDGSFGWSVSTLQEFRDPSAWYHFVINFNSTLATSTERIKIHVNGERVTALGGSQSNALTYPALNASGVLLDNKTLKIGSKHTGAFYDGYLAEVYVLDGIETDPSYFGATNEDTNQWQPKNPTDIKPTLTFGTNGFYLPFSNDALATSFTDSATGNAIGRTGDGVMTKTGQKKFGTASGFWDASADSYLTAGNSSIGATGTGDWTIEAWVYNDVSQADTNRSFFTQCAASNNDGLQIEWQASGNLTVWDYSLNNDWTDLCGTGGVATPIDTWFHLAVVRYGNTFKMYIDGTVAATTRTQSGDMAPTAGPQIGWHRNTSTRYLKDSYIDEFRISNVARYTANFTPAASAFVTDANTQLLLHLDGANDGTVFTDSSGWGGARHSLTAYGDTKNTRISSISTMRPDQAIIIGPKVGSSAISFDGDGDYLSIPDSADWNFGTGSFTIEGWVNHGGQDTVLYFDYTDYDAGNEDLIIFHINAAGEPKYDDANGGSGGAYGNFGQLPLNTWAHLAFVKIGTGLKCYIDGVAQLVKAGSSGTTDSYTLTMPASLPNHTSGLWIGRWGWNGTDTGTGRYTLGYMDEIRVSNVARYVANFTPDTTEFSSDANTKLLIHSNTTMGSTTFTDSGASTHTITAGGGIKHVANKVGTGMAVYNGTTSQMETLTAPAEWAFGTQDFTWDFWAYADAWTNNDCWFEAYAASNDYWVFRIKTNGDLAVSSYVGGSHVVDIDFNNANMPTGAWFHIELSRSGSTWRCFINGTETGDAQTSSGSLGTANRQLKIGRSGHFNTFFKGYIDELRISNIVRHTSNFTPSTTAHKPDINTMMLLHMDGGGGIDPETNIPTLPGQGTYFWDDATNAIFYGGDGVPTNKSIISFDGTGDYLSVPASTDFNPGTNFTVECWFQYGGDDEGGIIGNQNSSGYNGWFFRIVNTTDKLDWNNYGGSGGAEVQVITAGSLVWNTGQWYHLAMVKEGNDYELFRDGTSVATLTSSASLTNGGALFIGKDYASDETVCKMDQIRISDNARYSSNFTAPTTPFTTDANTLLLIQSDFSEGGLGADHSGNYNYFTPTNLVASDMMIDNPLNNFCTWNPIDIFAANLAGVVSEGNLKIVDSVNHIAYRGTFGLSSGKWYWEIYMITIGAVANCRTGICITNTYGTSSGTGPIDMGVAYTYDADGQKTIPGSTGAYGATYAAGDIVGVALDMDAGTITFYKNNATQGQMASGITDEVAPLVSEGNGSYQFDSIANFGQDSSFAGVKTAQGNQDGNNKGDFYYAPPAGYLALCTDNLSDPSIALPGEHFNTVLYAGNSSNDHAITGVGFQPDFVWNKSLVSDYHGLWDVNRGVDSRIYSNVSSAAIAGTDAFESFDPDGFSLNTNSTWNYTGNNYVSWNWKAGGTAVSNTDGSITTSVSANTTAGFSIVTYTGSSADPKSMGHGLSQAPQIIITKQLTNGFNWKVGADGLTNWQYIMELNEAGAQSHATGVYNGQAPTSTVWYASTEGGTGAPSCDYVAYCFHSVEGYSKVGKYIGNGLADGVFIYTGFRPAYMMVKRIDASNDWRLFDDKRDPHNVNYHRLQANLNNAQTTETWNYNDFVSNGFKWRVSDGGYNASGGSYLYMVFAESPFKTANAR